MPVAQLLCEGGNTARDKLSAYQSARLALSTNRIRLKDLPSNFGQKKGRDKYLFPEHFDKEFCLTQLDQLIEQHHETQLVKKEDIVNSFTAYLPECEAGGCRNQYYLHAFAGKDLFWAMDDWFKDNDLQGAGAFRERVLIGIQRATNDIADWLKEWADLREKIETT
ncbi:hypothetical protein MTBBW1_200016 [Desulfamplus magnetovallimortis]|uniref:Uncharacterized protein n=1 Tax=Desulfamplus magnetovallimortis TaxID=1246637 RepID=A0A1W1HBR3_9BACT|nr:hypothetical protein [Desulfamplus magnetovallimortis]SLM29879.1 hypothetical protein MTBBW1_200016 [Desulfamplus magnetovallimortis]